MTTKVKLIAPGVITPSEITLTTASGGTNTTAPATTAFVQQEISSLVDSSPGALNTLNELAAALGDDANFSTTVTNSIATKLPLAGGTITGTTIITGTAGRGLVLSNATESYTNNVAVINAQHSQGILQFKTANTERTRIDKDGNVGIGTSSPTSKLSIQSGISGSSTGVIDILQNTNGAQKQAASIGILVDNGGESTNAAGMFFQTASGGSLSERMRLTSSGGLELGYGGAARQQADSQAFSIITPASGGGQGIAFKRLDSNNDQQLGEISWSNNTQDGQANIRVKTAGAVNSTDMHFDVNNAGTLVTALSIDGSAGGNVGIGTSSPDAKLSVTSSTINSEDILYLKSGADNVNDYLGIAWELGVGGNGPHSAIRSFAGPSGSDARLGFLTTSDGGTTLTEGLSVAHNGNVGIGTSSPSQALEVVKSGFAYVRTRSTSSGFTGFDIGQHSGGGIYLNNRDNTNINFMTNNAQRMLLDNSGNLVIGTSSAYSAAKLSVAGSTVLANGNQFVIGTFGTSGLQLIGNAGGDNVVGTMGSSEPLLFRTGSTERMRIDSSGNLLVGKTVTSLATAGIALMSNDQVRVTTASDNPLELNRLSNDGDIIRFYRDALVGSIGVSSGSMYIQGNPATGKVGLTLFGSSIEPRDAGSASDGAVDLGATGSRFKELYLSSNLKVGGSSSFQFQKSGTHGYINQSDSGDLIFRMGSGFSERARITSAGKFGLGIASPSANIHIYSSGQAIARVEGANEYYSGLMIRNNHSSTQSQWHVAAAGGTSGWGAVNGNFIIRDDTTNSTGIEIERGAGGATGALYIGSNEVVFNEDSEDLDFRVENNTLTHAFYVSGGNTASVVGINQANPAAMLDIVTVSTAGADAIRLRQPSSSETYQLQLGVSGATNEGLVLRNTASTGLLQNWRANEVVINDDGVDRDFRVESDSNSHALFVEGSSSHVHINATTTPDANNKGFLFTSDQLYTSAGTSTTYNYQVRFYNGNGLVGSIATLNSGTSYTTSSDQRLKENIADADDAGSKVDDIQVRKFDWKVDGKHQKYGMIAQELIEVVPEAVSSPEDPEEMMGIDYSKLVPILIKEIQQLRQRVAQLEEK